MCCLCNAEIFADHAVCVSLSDVSKKWLRAFGSALIDKLQFRDSFVMLGQRGLTVPGSAIEQVAATFSTVSESSTLTSKLLVN